MRTAELALAGAVIIGCIFKIQHWPGAAFLFVIGGGGLALFYFPFGFRTLPAPKPTDQILWMTVLGGACLSAALSGLVAFLQRWPHNKELLVCGAIACAVSLMAALVLRYKHPRLDIYLDGLIVRCLVLGGLAITLWTLFAGKPR
ncbi:MAG: hypothetical protein JNN32_14140 [Flavobacteriales bacterium]|nr:hypothetical protein [Flavobacteriales bacterium]